MSAHSWLLACTLVACAARPPEPVHQAPMSCPAPAPLPTPVATPRAITPVFPSLRLENLRFRDVATCARDVCTVEGLSPFAPSDVAHDDGATTLPPALAWVHVIHPGATLTLAPRNDADLLGVVLVGEASLGFIDAARAGRVSAAPWSAFLLPGSGASLRAAGTTPVALLLVSATGDAPPRTGAGYTVRDLTALEDLAWNHDAQHARVAFEAPASPRASLGVLFFDDAVAVPEHNHPGTWELLVALSASGTLQLPAQHLDGASTPLAAHERTVTSGSIVYVPASVRHAWRPDGTHPLLAVQVYAPPGPEQRFRTLANTPASPTSTLSTPSGATAR